MKIFLDTADIEEIRTAARWGVLDGVTTNPSLYAKVGGSYDEILQAVCKITPGPVSAECVSDGWPASHCEALQGPKQSRELPDVRDCFGGYAPSQ